jgi:hypothetical protein
MESPTDTARRICPNWMSPTGDAHYRDVKAEIEKLHAERLMLAKLAAPSPQFFNPLHVFRAKDLRDSILSNAHVQPR